MVNPNIELQRLRAQQVKLLRQVGIDLAKQIRKTANNQLAGLSTEDVATVLNSSAVKDALSNLGKPAKKTKTAIVKASTGKRGRRSKVTDEQILAYLKTERSAGEIGKSLGQLIPKRVAVLVKDGKVSLRKNGLKKFYVAK